MIEIPSTERRRTVTWHDPATLAAAGRAISDESGACVCALASSTCTVLGAPAA